MATDVRIQPLADRVVIKPAEREEKTKSGIFLPDTASKERPMEGTGVVEKDGAEHQVLQDESLQRRPSADERAPEGE